MTTAAGLLIGALSSTLASAAPAVVEPQAGTWLTADGLSKIKISPCGPATATATGQPSQVYCAKIVWVRPPVTADDQPTYDQKKKFLGTNISSDLRHAEDNLLVGALLNPENGKSYNVKVRLKSANALEMGGCILGGLLCGSETWSRAADEVASAAPAHPPVKAAAKPTAARAPGATASPAAATTAEEE